MTNIVDSIDPDVNFYGGVGIQNKYYDITDAVTLFDKHNELSILHINIRSIQANLVNVLKYLTNIKTPFKVFGLRETWLNNSTFNDYEIRGYQHVCLYGENKKGGGVSMF
jgi:hypothetical protein